MPAKNEAKRRDAIDPAVADLLGHMDRKTEERSLSTADRQRRAKERAKAKARNRVMLDLPPEIEARIKAIATDESCPASQVAALLIWQGLSDLNNGLLDLDQFKKSSRSPRYNWNLVFLPKGEDDEF